MTIPCIIVACAWFSLGIGATADAQTPAPVSMQNPAETPAELPARTAGEPYSRTSPKEIVMNARASGTFEVRLAPLTPYNEAAAAGLGRMSIDKEFSGDLVATSKGEMLTAMTAVEGSAVYVAVERVSGTLHGRSGSFALHHTGVMDRGAQQLTVTVVPDSGTGELEGIAGTMTIRIEGGKHFYDLTYNLAPTPVISTR